MKILVVALVILVGLFAGSFRGPRHSATSGIIVNTASPTPNSDRCLEKDFQHKTEAEIAEMTPRQLIDEAIKDQLCPTSTNGSYGLLVDKYFLKAGITTLPILTEYMNNYDPQRSGSYEPTVIPAFEETRFFVALTRAENVDNSVARLRGCSDGKSAIEALQNGVDRMRELGYDNAEHKNHGNFEFALVILKELRGVNVRDEQIRTTLAARRNVEIADKSLLDFSNFLTSLDPKYPSWSEVNEAGSPLLLKDDTKYFEAYLKFKSRF